jgi:HemY protein
VRALFWVLLLAALAVAVTLAARYNAGYVLLVVHPYRVELSLSFLVALLLVGFAAFYVLLRVVTHTVRLPDQVRQFRERRRLARASESLLAALRAYLEGRYAKAEKAAAESIALKEHSGLAALVAARAAHELRAYERRDAYLARAAYYRDEDRTMRIVAKADLLLNARQHQEALAALDELPQKHTAALRLELRAQQQARNWDRYIELVNQLERLAALDEGQAWELRRGAIGENIARKARDADDLRAYWQRLGSRERQDPKVAACAAQAFAQLGQSDAALPIIEQSLERNWDADLVRLYGVCMAPDTMRQVERAEAWLRAHPDDPALLLALGRLCARAQLWGKAKSYLEASLSLEDSFQCRIELARLLERLGEADAARRHYEASLRLAQDELEPRAGAPLRQLPGVAAEPTQA